MASQPSRHRSKWSLDFSTKAKGSSGSSTSELPSPPGYLSSTSGIHAEAIRQTDPGLRAKRAWDMALAPIKQLPMNFFIMYMSGNTISIFPIMMVIMLFVRPIKTLFSVAATFRALDALVSSGESNESGSATGIHAISTIGQKFIFVLGNFLNLAMAMYKCHSMGLLPTHASDWLDFADPVERAEWSYA